jgi:hypothetical protein
MSEQKIIGYILGLIDAEASFSVSIKLQKDMKYGIRIDPTFTITQSEKKPLEIIAKTIGAGRIIRKPGQRHLYLLVIDRIDELAGKLLPFLEKQKDLLYVKKKHYLIFKEVVASLYEGRIKNIDEIKELVTKAYLLSSLSTKAHRKRSFEQIIQIINSYSQKQRELPGER